MTYLKRGLYRGNRDTGYLPFYFQGYSILSILLPGIKDTLFNFRDTVFFCQKKKKEKKNSKSPFERRELKKKTFTRKIFDLHNLTVLMASFYKQQEEGFQKCLEISQPVSIVRVLKNLLRSGAL